MIHGSLSLKMRSYSLFLVVRQPSFLAILDAAIDKAIEGVMTPADKVLPRTDLEVGLFVFIVVLCLRPTAMSCREVELESPSDEFMVMTCSAITRYIFPYIGPRYSVKQ